MTLSGSTRTMKAVARGAYGISALAVEDVPLPELEDTGVLVRVRAASINQYDVYDVLGRPWIARPMTGMRGPRGRRLTGQDFSGTVEAVGEQVPHVQVGDDVFGMCDGALAEYLCTTSDVVRKPVEVTFAEAAALPMAGLTALQGLRDHGSLQPGQKVLVNGASGGVGTFAVQIAKALDAEVTAVCSTGNVEQARALGADRVVDYTQEDFTQTGQSYDVILDVAGTRRWSHYRRVMDRDAVLVLVGAPSTSRLLGPLRHTARVKIGALPGRQKAKFFMASPNSRDLTTLADLMASGLLTSVIADRFPLEDAADAIRHVAAGHARGKVVIDVPG